MKLRKMVKGLEATMLLATLLDNGFTITGNIMQVYAHALILQNRFLQETTVLLQVSENVLAAAFLVRVLKL
jgi:hypothetical protein